MLLLAALGAASALMALGPAHAQDSRAYPNRPIKVIVPFPPGGPTDGMARIISERLGTVLGQSIVIENRGGGAGGSVGAKVVASADPDGYTILMTPGGSLTTGPAVHKNIGYDPLKAFTPVGLLIVTHQFISVHPSLPVNTLPELVAYARANPGKANYASSGHGTSVHLSGELFNKMTGLKLQHIPYRGAGPALNDLIPGRVDVMFNNIGAVMPLIKGGQLRALGVTSSKRAAELPDVPTVSEAGVPGFDVSAWYALFVPARTPPAVIQKLHADTVLALADLATKTRLEQLGVGVIGSSPEELRAYLKAEMDKWGVIIKEAGIKVE